MIVTWLNGYLDCDLQLAIKVIKVVVVVAVVCIYVYEHICIDAIIWQIVIIFNTLQY